MEAMFTEDASKSETRAKKPHYMLDRSLIDERARSALESIPHSKAPVFDQADEEGFTERAEERLREAAVWLHSEREKKDSIKNLRIQGRTRVKEMEMRRREAMKSREDGLRRRRLDEIFDLDQEGEIEPKELEVEPITTNLRLHRSGPPVPRLSKTYTKDIEIPDTQSMNDSSIIPSPGVPIVSRKDLETNAGTENDDEEDALRGGNLGASREMEEVQEILIDVQSSLEMPRLTTPAPTGHPAPLSKAESSIGSPGVDIIPRGAAGGVSDVSFDVNQSAFGAGSVSDSKGQRAMVGDVKLKGRTNNTSSVVRRQQWLQKGKAHAQEQREKRREAVRKEKEAKEEAEKKKKERLLALDIRRRKLRTAPLPETAKRRFDSLRANFKDMEDNNRILPERAYSQQAFRVGVAGDDVDRAVSEALRDMPKEDIIAGTKAQQRISMGKAPISPQAIKNVDSNTDAGSGAVGTILDVDEGDNFDMAALLKQDKAEKVQLREENEDDDEKEEEKEKGQVQKDDAVRVGAATNQDRPSTAGQSRTGENKSSSNNTVRVGKVGVHAVPKRAVADSRTTAIGSSVRRMSSAPTSTSSARNTSKSRSTLKTEASRMIPPGKKSARGLHSSRPSQSLGSTRTTLKPTPRPRPEYGLKAVRKALKTRLADETKAKVKRTTKGNAGAADTLDLLEQSDLIVTKSSMPGASVSGVTKTEGTTSRKETVAARRQIAEKKATSKFKASSSASRSSSTSIPESVSPSSPSRMKRGNAFPVNTRAGGYKSPRERAQAFIKRKNPSPTHQQEKESTSLAASDVSDNAKSLDNSPEEGSSQVKIASQQLAQLTAQIGRRVESDLEIQKSIDVTDPEQVKARLAVEMSNRMFYQRDSLRPPVLEIVEDEDDVYEDTGSHDSELENSATMDKVVSPSAVRRPGSSYGRRSNSPVSPSDARRFGAGGVAEGLVAVGATAAGTTATSTTPLSPNSTAAMGILAHSSDSADGDSSHVEDIDHSVSNPLEGHDASFEVENSDDVILDDDVSADADADSEGILEVESDVEDADTTDVKRVGESPIIKVGKGAGEALSRNTSTDEVDSQLLTDPLAGDYAEYITKVGADAGTGVAAKMMDMPRNSNATASTATVASSSDGNNDLKIIETGREDILGELEKLEADHHREMARIAAANRGSDYETPFSPLPAMRHQTPSEMKVQDDHDADLNIGLDMIADRQKLSKAYDEATTKALRGFEETLLSNQEEDLGGGVATSDSTPEDVKKAALRDIKLQEEKAERNFVLNFNVENMDMPSIREKRRIEIEEAVMKEREINMRDPFKGPSIRNRGELARELSSTYDATTVGNGLEGMIKGSKFKSWHEEVHATLAAGERRAKLEEERRLEIEENEAYLLDDEDEEDDEDETLVVNILARELAEQKEVIREKLVEKHSKHLKEEAVKQAKIAAGEKDIKNELFADALTAINGPSEVGSVAADPIGSGSGENNKENAGENANVTVGAAQQSTSFWDTMQYVHSPLERRYNASDAPEGGPLFEGVDMENILLQSLMIAHKPDEWLRKDKEKREGFNAKREIRDAINKARGKETTMGNVLDEKLSTDDVLTDTKAAGAEMSAPLVDGPVRYSPSQLRERMNAELKRQEEIHAYALELAEMEQAQAVQTASQVVEKIMQQASTDIGDIQRQQEMALQQQAYELSLTTAVNSVQAALAEETAKHQAKVQELELQLRKQALVERELRMHASSPTRHQQLRGVAKSGVAARKSAEKDTHSMASSADINDDYSAVFEVENESQLSSAINTSHGSPSKSINRSIPSILDDIHASADFGDDNSTVYTVEEVSQLRSSGGPRYRDDSLVDAANEVEEEDSIAPRVRSSASSGRSAGTYSESDSYDDMFEEDSRERGSAEADQDDSLSVTGSESADVSSKKPFSTRPSLSSSPVRSAGASKAPTRDRKGVTTSKEGAASARSSASDSRSNVKFHQDTRSPRRQKPRHRHVASSLDSAVTMLSSADENEDSRRGFGSGGSSAETKDVTAKMLGEYRAEMESRLRSQDKALKMRIHFLKTRRSHRLAVLEEKRQRIKKSADKDGKGAAVSGEVRKVLRSLDRDEANAKAEYEESRAELERERWTLNARAYRELRKFNSLKRDFEATSLGNFVRGEMPSPSTPDRYTRRDGLQTGSANRDRPVASWAKSRPSTVSSEGYSSLESSPSTGTERAHDRSTAVRGTRQIGAQGPDSTSAPDSSEKSSSGDSSASSEKDPHALSVSMLSTGRSVLSNVSNSMEKPPLANNNRKSGGSVGSMSPGVGATTAAGVALVDSPGIAMRSTSPPSAKARNIDESASLTESAIAETLAEHKEEKVEEKEKKVLSPTVSPTNKQPWGTPESTSRQLNNSTDTLEELEKSIEQRSRRVQQLQSNLENMQSREARLQALKDRQAEKARLIAMEKDLSLRISSEELYRDLSATQIKRLAAIGALPKDFIAPPDEDEVGMTTQSASGTALASLRASAEKATVDEDESKQVQLDDTTEQRLAALTTEDRARVQLLQKALRAPEPLEADVVEEEMELHEDSWESRDSASTSGNAANLHAGSGIGIAESGDATSNEITCALTARINQEEAAVAIQAAYRRLSARKTFIMLRKWTQEAKDDFISGADRKSTLESAILAGNIANEHKRLLQAQDEALDDSWASESSRGVAGTSNSGLFDPEDDDTTGLLSTAVDRLHKAIRARDSAEKQRREKMIEEENQRVAQSIAKFSEAAAAAQRSADAAQQSVKTLDARIEAALHGRPNETAVEESSRASIPIPTPIVTDFSQPDQVQDLGDEEGSSVEFSIGDPESVPASTATSPRSVSDVAKGPASASSGASAGILDTSASTVGDERSDFLSAAGSLSTSPDKSSVIRSSPRFTAPDMNELPTALEQSYSSVISAASAASAGGSSKGGDTSSASFDASASIGAAEAAQKRRDAIDRSSAKENQDEDQDVEAADFEPDEAAATTVPLPEAAVPPVLAEAVAAVNSSRDGSLASSLAEERESAEGSEFEVGSDATDSGDEDEGNRDEEAFPGIGDSGVVDATEDSDFEVGSIADEVDDEESIGSRSVSSSGAEQTMVPPAPSTPEPEPEKEPAEVGLTAVDSSPTKVSVPGSSPADSASHANEESSSSPDRATRDTGASSGLGISQSETVAWDQSKALPGMQFSDAEPNIDRAVRANKDGITQHEQGHGQEGEGEDDARQSLESNFSGKTVTASRTSLSEGEIADLTAISGIQPGSSVESGSLISTASDVAALRAAGALTGSVDVSLESGQADADAHADADADAEEKTNMKEEAQPSSNEGADGQDEEIVEELEESIEELDDSQVHDADSEPPSKIMELHELAELRDPPNAGALEDPQQSDSVDSNSGLDISALAASPTPQEQEQEQEQEQKQEQEEVENQDAPAEEQSLTSLSGLPSLPVPAPASAEHDEDLYVFDATPAAPMAALAAPGAAGAAGGPDATSPTSDGSSSGPTLSTALENPIDWTDAVLSAGSSLLSSADWTSITSALRNPDYSESSHGAFFTPETVQAVLGNIGSESYQDRDIDRNGILLNAKLVADRFNEILTELHIARHPNKDVSGTGLKGGHRFELGSRLLAETHPLSEEALSETLMGSLRKSSADVSEVLSGRKHFLEMVEVDAISQFKRDYSKSLAAAADEIADIIMARALVDAVEVFDEEISEQAETLLGRKENKE